MATYLDGLGVQSRLFQRSLVSLPSLGKAILVLQSAALFGSSCCLYQRKPMTTNDHAHITWRISAGNTLGQAHLLGGLVTLEGKGRWEEMVDQRSGGGKCFGFSPTCVGRRRKGKSESRTLEAAKKIPWHTARHSRDFFQLFRSSSSYFLFLFSHHSCLCTLFVLSLCVSIRSLYGVKVYVSIFFSTFFFFFAERGKL